MNNLMDSTKIATLFLDNMLLVKHFTNQMTVVSRLIPSDVGRPVTDIASDLIYPELEADIREVQQTLVTTDKQVMSRNGSWFNARILPYHTLEGKSDGLVITFVDITKSKQLETELLLKNDKLLGKIEQGHMEVAATLDLDNSKL
jgi:two-component system CheB/CheR fusion protein